jgi:flagellar motor protein MotB
MAQSLLQPRPTSEEEGNYFVSVSDLMVGMLFIFIIILMAFALNFRIAEDDATGIQGHLTRERDEVGREMRRLAVERDLLAVHRDALAEERDELGAVTNYLLRNDRIRNEMLAAVQSLLRERRVEVSLDPENGILRLPESLLFDSARAVLRPEGARALRELAAVLPCAAGAAERLPDRAQAPARGRPRRGPYRYRADQHLGVRRQLGARVGACDQHL